jgi:dipeptidyl aminopeptidase/acylaminoacyl peptidase
VIARRTHECAARLRLAAVLVAAALPAACSSGGASARSAAVPDRRAYGVASAGDVAAAVDSMARADPSVVARDLAAQVERKRWTDYVFARVLGDEMIVRKTGYFAPDGLAIPAYLFAPLDTARRRPVLLFVHGGVHGDFGVAHLDQVRALVRQGYVVVAPEYRGSTGYGAALYDAIDYGGREVDDVVAARDWLAREVAWADVERLGVMGYSHGGYIALLAVIRRADLFRVAVAHVPVADLPTRMRTHLPEYEALFAAQPAYGASLAENPAPYVARSPSTQARRLRTPVLVHAADNDDDVFIVENRILRDSMVAAGKDRAGLYTYREWHAPPGGHSFGVLDTPEGRESWRETMAFLGRHLPARATRPATGPPLPGPSRRRP